VNIIEPNFINWQESPKNTAAHANILNHDCQQEANNPHFQVTVSSNTNQYPRHRTSNLFSGRTLLLNGPSNLLMRGVLQARVANVAALEPQMNAL
jgi:hypothetical protein